ncbi:MAG: EamA family transporter [Candidatus Micrarchaeaceae archaeon]
MKIFFAFVAMISCTVVANLLMKVGAANIVNAERWWRILNPKIILGLAFFGCALLIYVLILHKLPLNVAQSFASAQFIAVILAAAFVLGEPVQPVQLIGISFITLGIALIGWTR